MSSSDSEYEAVTEMNDSGSTPDSNRKTLHVIWDDDKIEKVRLPMMI